MDTTYVTFSSDENILHSRIDSVNKDSPCIIFLSGASGKSLTSRFDYLSDAFTKEGFTFFRFNFRGQEVGRTINDSTIEEELTDLKNALIYLKANDYNLKKFGIISKSLGNIKTLLLNDERLSCIGMLAPATFFGNNPNIETIKNIKYSEIKELTDIIFDEKILTSVAIPILIVHGDCDTVIPLENSKNIFAKIKSSNKKIVIVPGADHSLDNTEQDQRLVTESLISFFKENLH